VRRVLWLLGLVLILGVPTGCGNDEPNQRSVTIFLLGEGEDGPELVRTEVQQEATDDPSLDAVSALLGYGIDESGQLMGWAGCIAADQAVAIDVDDDLVTVDLHTKERPVPSTCDFTVPGHRAWIQQMVWTVQEATGVAHPVRVTVDGVERIAPTSADPRIDVRG
jgi:hypothetical protein